MMFSIVKPGEEMRTREARPRIMRGVASYPLSERSYALGGGGSGDRVTDRNSFAVPSSSSRHTGTEVTSSRLGALKAFGAHDAITLHALGAHGNEQSPWDRSVPP